MILTQTVRADLCFSLTLTANKPSIMALSNITKLSNWAYYPRVTADSTLSPSPGVNGMKHLGYIVTLILWVLLAIGSPTRGLAQEVNSAVRPALASQVITVTVTDMLRSRHGVETDVLIARAVGFPNDTCDVITTFDVIQKYELRQTWTKVKQRLDIVVNGTAYPAKFRDIGAYPLGLNLACIDFDSPLLHAGLKIPVLPLEDESAGLASASYDNDEVFKINPGTPLLNKRGEISSVLVATTNGELEFASARDIRTFLKVAANAAR